MSWRLSSAFSALAVLIVILILMVARPMTESQTYLKEAQAHAERFQEEWEPEQLREAYQALENVLLVEEDDPETRSQLRAESLRLWLQLIQLIDRHLDPDFDPDDVPERLIQPPPTSEGVILRPGASPSKIDDPKVRAEYEKAIADNRAKTIHYGFQIRLRRLNERITPRAEDFIRNFYTPAPPDQEELRAAIDEIITDVQRKAELSKLLAPSTP